MKKGLLPVNGVQLSAILQAMSQNKPVLISFPMLVICIITMLLCASVQYNIRNYTNSTSHMTNLSIPYYDSFSIPTRDQSIAR